MKRAAWLQEFAPAQWIPAVSAGLIAGVLGVILQISFAALIFSGDLSPLLGKGIGLALFSGFVLAFVVALTSSFPVSVASPQDSPAAIFAVLTLWLSVGLTETRDTSAYYATVIAALATTTLLTGAFFFGLGWFRLGKLVRFIPYPVVGGFLAGTGWLLLQGGVNVMTGAQLTPEWIYLLSQPGVLVRWLPGVLLACVLLIVLRRWSHALLTPAILFIAIVLIYFALTASGLSLEQARARSWMLGPFPEGSLFQFLTPTAFADANWMVILRQSDKIVTILIVSVLALLLNASGIELAAKRDIDFNRELRAAGLANLLAGIAAGLPGYHLLGATTLSYRLGARSRLTGITAAFFIGFTLLFGAAVLEYIPRPVLGGLLVYLGISFLVDWLFDAYFKLPHLDYALIVVILVVIAAFGFLAGVGVGLVIAVLLFLVNYSRIRVVKNSFTGLTYRSNVDRSAAERLQLRASGDQLLILQLQEFIFFGTAQTLLDAIRARIQDTTRPPLLFLVLSFRRVSGLDSSAVASFLRIQQLTSAQQIQLVLTDVPPPIQSRLVRGGLGENVNYLATLDRGVEWCEERLLADSALNLPPESHSFTSQLSQFLADPHDLDRIMPYLEQLELPAQTTLLNQGDPADALYFIHRGQVSVELHLADGKIVRLRTIRHGTVVGEVAMYLGGERTASVVTLEPTTAYRLTARAVLDMERNDPDLAAALHKWIASVMAERLADNVRTLEAVMDEVYNLRAPSIGGGFDVPPRAALGLRVRELREAGAHAVFDEAMQLCYISVSPRKLRRNFFILHLQEHPISDRLRVNEQIRAREVRVIDDASGKQLGILAPREAIAMARERNLDLVEVAPNANPPVCRIMDYGKFQYERTKKEREAKRAQKVIEVKEVRIRPKTAMYHVGFKLNRVRDWIKRGNKVKIRILFRAREITHSNLGRETLEQIAGDMADIATVEQAPLMDGKSLVMLLGPGPQKGGADAARRGVRYAKARPADAAALAAMPASTSVEEAEPEATEQVTTETVA